MLSPFLLKFLRPRGLLFLPSSLPASPFLFFFLPFHVTLWSTRCNIQTLFCILGSNLKSPRNSSSTRVLGWHRPQGSTAHDWKGKRGNDICLRWRLQADTGTMRFADMSFAAVPRRALRVTCAARVGQAEQDAQDHCILSPARVPQCSDNCINFSLLMSYCNLK